MRDDITEEEDKSFKSEVGLVVRSAMAGPVDTEKGVGDGEVRNDGLERVGGAAEPVQEDDERASVREKAGRIFEEDAVGTRREVGGL